MKQDKRFAAGPNRGTGNGSVTFSPVAPQFPKHGDEWIDQNTEFTTVPASSTDVGIPGQTAGDSGYFYYCYAVNSWGRIAKDGSW